MPGHAAPEGCLCRTLLHPTLQPAYSHTTTLPHHTTCPLNTLAQSLCSPWLVHPMQHLPTQIRANKYVPSFIPPAMAAKPKAFDEEEEEEVSRPEPRLAAP